MNKDFEEFKKYWHTMDAQSIQDSIIVELNEYADEHNIPDDDRFIWSMRSFNAKLTMKMLEEYHKWLNA